MIKKIHLVVNSASKTVLMFGISGLIRNILGPRDESPFRGDARAGGILPISVHGHTPSLGWNYALIRKKLISRRHPCSRPIYGLNSQGIVLMCTPSPPHMGSLYFSSFVFIFLPLSLEFTILLWLLFVLSVVNTNSQKLNGFLVLETIL